MAGRATATQDSAFRVIGMFLIRPTSSLLLWTPADHLSHWA